MKKNGELTYFPILKFRTMKTSTPKDMPTHLLENPEQWITGIGKILRKTSLDEFPQFINVLIGNMSLIGPRAVVDGEIEKYEDFKRVENEIMENPLDSLCNFDEHTLKTNLEIAGFSIPKVFFK